MIETVRCFVACDLSLDLVRAVTGLQRDVRGTLGDDLPVRWVSPATMHLTLRFLGAKVDKGVTVAVADAVMACARDLQAFDLKVAGVGAFPSPSRARVIWVGANDDTGRLEVAQAAVERAMEDLGFEPERRGFHAHVLGDLPADEAQCLALVLVPLLPGRKFRDAGELGILPKSSQAIGKPVKLDA